MTKLGLKFAAMLILQCAFQVETQNSFCDGNSSDSRSLGLSVNSMKTNIGKWTDSFYARAEHSNTLSNISVDVVHNITECSGRRIIQVQGFIQNGNSSHSVEKKSANYAPSIAFHSKHGSNVVLSNNGRTIEKKDLTVNENGAAFTNRPLEIDELFEVRLDRKGKRSNLSFRIGVLTKKPEDVAVLPRMLVSKYAWLYIHDAIFNEGSIKRRNYGADLDDFLVGSKFGVVRKASGDIHFFVNEVDQGPAVSGISDPVYAIVEIMYNAEKMTILAP